MMQSEPNSVTSIAEKSGKVPMLPRSLIAFVCLAAMLVAAGCGRRPSDLLTPYEAQLEAQREAEKAGQPVPPAPEKPVTDKRFILDGLID